MKLLTKRIFFLTSAALAAASGLAAQVGGNPPPIGDFGLMGGALGQTLRLNVMNPARTGDVQPLPCHVLVGFKGIRGAILRPVQDLNLAPGRAAFVELNFNSLVSRLGERSGARKQAVSTYCAERPLRVFRALKNLESDPETRKSLGL